MCGSPHDMCMEAFHQTFTLSRARLNIEVVGYTWLSLSTKYYISLYHANEHITWVCLVLTLEVIHTTTRWAHHVCSYVVTSLAFGLG